MTIEITFPTGTPSGHAFASLPAAIEWLRDAANGVYGPATWTDAARNVVAHRVRRPGFADDDPTGGWSIVPFASTSWPKFVQRIETTDEAIAYSIAHDGDPEEINYAAGLARRIDSDGGLRYIARDSVVELHADDWLTQYRSLDGYRACAHRHIREAKDRRVIGAILTDLERAMHETSNNFLRVLNREFEQSWATATQRENELDGEVVVELSDDRPQSRPVSRADRPRRGYF